MALIISRKVTTRPRYFSTNSNKTETMRPHKLTNRGPDERRGVSDVVETLLLDEVSHGRGKVLVMSFHIVLQDQAAQGTSRLV